MLNGKLVRAMEPPVRSIDVGELSANLPEGHGLLFEYGYRSLQPKGDIDIGNDAELTASSALALVQGGARIGADIGAYAVANQLVGKDRDLATTIIIAPGADIARMRESDNLARLIQSGRDVSLFDRLRIRPDPAADPDTAVTNSPPEIDPPEEPAVADGHIVRQISTWYGGENFSRATLDTNYVLQVSDGRDWSAAPANWPTDGDLQTMVCAAYQNAGGKWVGGKFDWNRINPSPRDFKHLAAGYKGWVAPPAGTELTLWAASIDGKRVSTTAKATYK
jgi:hypothetical protein